MATTVPTSINTFKNHFTSVRPTLFKVTPVYPNFNGATQPDAHLPANYYKDFYFYAKSTTLPASVIGEIEVPFMGRKFYEHGDREFNPWDITIVNSQDFAIRNWLETWMNGMNQHEVNKETGDLIGGDGYFRGMENGSSSPYYNYFCDFTIEQLNRRNEVIACYRMVDAFPTNCGDITLDYSSVNTIEEFTATFRYQYWVRQLIDEPGPITDVVNDDT